MSTIDQPKIIADLLKRKGFDKFEGAKITQPDKEDAELAWFEGRSKRSTTKTLLMDARYNTETIWEYTSGFGTKCWKLIYGMYANTSLTEEDASVIFLATANILPGSECRAILFRGELTALGREHLAKFG